MEGTQAYGLLALIAREKKMHPGVMPITTPSAIGGVLEEVSTTFFGYGPEYECLLYHDAADSRNALRNYWLSSSSKLAGEEEDEVWVSSAASSLFNVPMGTAAFAAFCLFIYHFQVLSLDSHSLRPNRILDHGEYYRFLTNPFVHSNQNHLICNVCGILRWGKECEELVGTLRLVEATLWCILMESVWVWVVVGLLLPNNNNGGLRYMSVVGFSGAIFFWKALAHKGIVVEEEGPREMDTDRLFQMALIGFMIVDEIADCFRGKLGSAFHLLGFLNGVLYHSVIRPRWSIPADWLRRVEHRLDNLSLAIGEFLGMGEDFLYVVTAANDDDEGDSDSAEEEDSDDDSELEELLKRKHMDDMCRILKLTQRPVDYEKFNEEL